jgi:fructose-1,6-bisphosphatase/inositol monophosphatase family enzyme
LDGTNNATSSNYASGLMIGSLALFHIARNTPVAAVVRNIGKDLATASKHVGNFFSKNTECAVDQEQKTVTFSNS